MAIRRVLLLALAFGLIGSANACAQTVDKGEGMEGVPDARGSGLPTGTSSGYQVSRVYALELGDTQMLLQAAEGGHMAAGVVQETATTGADPGGFPGKRLGPPRCVSFTITLTEAPQPALAQWLTETLQRNPAPRNGFVTEWSGPNGPCLRRTEFSDARITAIRLNAFDSASRTPGRLEITFAPASVSTPGRQGWPPTPPAAPGSRAWLASGFRVESGAAECLRIRSVSPIEVLASQANAATGADQFQQVAPLTLQFGDVSIAFDESDDRSRSSWEQWFQRFAVNGNNDQAAEQEVTLTILSPRQQALFGLRLRQVGIFCLCPDATKGVRNGRLRADLYCESVDWYVP